MKLISKGTPKDAIWAGKCLCCDSKYEASKKELTCEHSPFSCDPREGDSYCATCEVCGNKTYFFIKRMAP